MSTYIVPLLARTITSTVGHDTLLTAHPKVASSLAENKTIDTATWDRLYRGSKVDVAVALARRPLDEHQLNQLLREKRTTVHATVMEKGLTRCTEPMARALLSARWFDPRLAGLWLRHGVVPDSVRTEVLRIENGPYLIQSLAETERFDLDEAIELLGSARQIGARKVLWRLFDRRPELIEPALTLVSADRSVRRQVMIEAIAGSRHLFAPEVFETILAEALRESINHIAGQDIWVTLLVNPNTPKSMVDRMLADAPARFENPGSRHRPYSTAHLAQLVREERSAAPYAASIMVDWAQTEGVDRQRVLDAGDRLSALRYPTLASWFPKPVATVVPNSTPVEPVDDFDQLIATGVNDIDRRRLIGARHTARIEARLDSSGRAAWETLWSLVDDWHGTLGELLTTCESLG